MEGLFIPITLFVSIAAVLLGFIFNRTKVKAKQQQTIQKIIESGQNLSPELIASVAKKEQNEHVDISRGILLICFAVAMVIFGLMGIKDSGFAWLGAFPLALGVAFLIIDKIKRSTV
jgi:Mg2+ and Co2+ transporter CorA